DQLVGVELVALDAPLTPIHLNTRRIHNHIGDAASCEVAVQPEAVTACFVATDHRRGVSKFETLLRLGDFLLQGRQVPSSNRPLPRLLSVADRKGEFPMCPTQLESQVQDAALCANITRIG